MADEKKEPQKKAKAKAEKAESTEKTEEVKKPKKAAAKKAEPKAEAKPKAETTAKKDAPKKVDKKAKESESAEPIGLTLTSVSPASGAHRKKMRKGRGRATGCGKTCNRGHNGEGQRAGRSRKRGFEGGQMPGYRKVPKVDGFKLVNPRKWLELNVSELDRVLLKDEAELTYDMLKERGFLRNGMDGLRVLGKGDCGRKITIHAHYVTPGAQKKIEAAGGSVVIVPRAEKAAVEAK